MLIFFIILFPYFKKNTLYLYKNCFLQTPIEWEFPLIKKKKAFRMIVYIKR